MKFQNELHKAVFDYFNERPDFHFHGWTGTAWFKTWEKDKEKFIIESKKPYGGKTMISASVQIYPSGFDYEKYGVQLKIEMFMWGYQTEDVVFEGWVENIDELKIICKAVGL